MLQKVVNSLRAIGSPGTFATRATLPFEDLRIDAQGVGPIRQPVSCATARKPIGIARPAVFGRGERTVRDAQVRDTWEVAR